MALAPGLADVDLLFAVVLVVELDDAVGEGEDSLSGPGIGKQKQSFEVKATLDLIGTA